MAADYPPSAGARGAERRGWLIAWSAAARRRAHGLALGAGSCAARRRKMALQDALERAQAAGAGRRRLAARRTPPQAALPAGAAARPLGRRAHRVPRQPADGRRPGLLRRHAAAARGPRPEAVLVQRGWVPRDLRDRTLLPAVPTPPGQVEVAGRIAPPPARLYEFADAASGAIRQNLDLGAFRAESGLPLAPLSVQQTDSPPCDGLLREWPRPAVDVQKHYGYAFQWFALCALMAGLYVWFQLVRPRLRARCLNPARRRWASTVHFDAVARAEAARPRGAPPRPAGRCCWCCWSARRRWWPRTSPTT